MRAKKKILIFCILTVSLIALIIVFRPKSKSSEYLTKYYWSHKTHNTEKFDFVFVGDSRLYRGLSPTTVVEGTDYTGYNFGYSSGSVSELMLDHADKHLDRTENPTVIFAISPHVFSADALKDDHFLQEYERSDYDLFERLYLSKYLHIFDRMTPEELFGKLDHYTDEVCHPDGWMSSESPKINTEEGIEKYKKVLTGNPLSTEAMENLYLRTERWVRNGVRVFAYRPPTLLKMEKLEEDMAGFNEPGFIQDFENAGGIWINLDKVGYQTYDGSHLQKDQVIKLSKFLRGPLGIE